jgi:membrane protease YdiL (CAAX protease family)
MNDTSGLSNSNPTPRPPEAGPVIRPGSRALHNILKGPQGLRAGWRLLIYGAVVFALGFATSKLSDSMLHGRQPELGRPGVAAVTMGILAIVLLLSGWAMTKIEGRSFAEYGLPRRGALGLRFWQGWAIGLISITVLLLVLRLAGFYSFGPLQLHGAEIWKNGFLWLAAMILAALAEEFFYRGYLQFTLTTGIAFWPAALITSFFMAYNHHNNPDWTWLGLCTVGGFGLIACFLLRRTGDLWLPIGLHAAWDWGDTYFYGIPDSGLMGQGSLLHGSFHGPAWATGMPFGVEAGWPNVALFLIWWFLFAKWLREVKYPHQNKPASS